MEAVDNKIIEIEVTLNKRRDGYQPLFSNGKNSRRFTGLRSLVQVQNVSAIVGNACHIQMWGMLEFDMMQLSTYARPYFTNPALIQVMAGDLASGLSSIFTGTLYAGTLQYQSMPKVHILLEAQSAYQYRVDVGDSVSAISFDGEVQAEDIITGLANKMNMKFVNHGVSKKVTDVNLSGNLMAQLREICNQTKTAYSIENNTLHIWPDDRMRDDEVITLSPDTGLVGYPEFFPMGIVVRSLFEPRLRLGSRVQVQSTIAQATGEWIAHSVSHHLSQEYPGGPWFTSFYGAQVGTPYVGT